MKPVFRLEVAGLAAACWILASPVSPAQDGVVIEINGNAVVLDAKVVVKQKAKAKGKEGDKEKEKPKIEFPPKLEKALAEFVEKCVEARREPAQKEIEEVIGELAEFHKLDEAATEKLKTLSKKAVESSLKPFAEVVDKFLRDSFQEENEGAKPEEGMEEFLEEVGKADAAEFATEIPLDQKARPDQQPEWEAAMKEVLTEEQRTAWAKNLEKDKAKLEKALAELVEKCVEARREPAQKEIEEVIGKLAEFHKLDEAATEKLKTLSKTAVESSLKPFAEVVDKYLRDAFEEENGGGTSEEGVEKFLKEVGKADAAEVASEIPPGEKARPDQQPEWEAAMKEVLTEEQLTAWTINLEEEKAKIEQQFAKLVEITSDNYKRQYGAKMDPLVDDILSTVGLDETRSKKLKEASEKAIDAFVDHWKKKAVEYLEGAEESRREAMLKRGYVSIGVDTDSLPEKQKVWTESLDLILTKAEKDQWDKALANRDSRREQAATLMMVAAVDELMALTAEQRNQLKPLLTDEAISPLTTQLKRDYWGSMSVTRIVQNAKTADQKKIEAVLDDSQWKRWEAAVNPPSRSKPKPKKGEEPPKPPPGPNPVAMEKAITAHMYKMMLTEREKILSRILVQAEDAGRILSLPPEACAQMQTAAKGAAEEEINTWSNNMNNWVRRSIKGATPATIETRLKNLGSVRFGRSKKATESPIWEAAVATHLSEEQREIWQQEIDRRQIGRREATAALIVTQLDNAARLTAEQIGQLEPLLVTSIKEYGPDINKYFSSWSNDTPWYLNSYYNMIPFQGIPEKESKKILTKAQWKIWEERFHTRVSHYWDQVLEYHNQRIKKEKAEEAKKEKEKEAPAEDKEAKEAVTES